MASKRQTAALKRAIRIAGSRAALGQKIGGISGQAVGKWLKAGVPPERVLDVEAATLGAVSRHDLRPDIYPREAPSLDRSAVNQSAAG